MVADLSHHHEPITSYFNIASLDDWNQYRLTNDQIEFFHEHGYLAAFAR
jgi:hypothetical protein